MRHIQILLLALVDISHCAAVNLFMSGPAAVDRAREGGERHGGSPSSSSDLRAKKATRCEVPILEELGKLNGTGAKAYRVSERDIQLCPNYCDRTNVVDKYCRKHEHKYLEALGAEVRSARCCDAARCNCVCHFDCRTFMHKEREYKSEGFKHCVWAWSKDEVLVKASAKCKGLEHSLQCRSHPGMKFVCPRQFLCLQQGPAHSHDHRCLACVNPACVTREDKKITAMLLTAQNETEQHDYLEMKNRPHKHRRRDSRGGRLKKPRSLDETTEDVSGGIVL